MNKSTAQDLAGRRALITGASRGIGRAEALTLAEHGAAVAVGYGRSREAADDVVAEITTAGGTAVAVRADVADPDQIPGLVEETVRALGGLDILVSNAGIEHFGELGAVTAADVDAVFAVNTRGQYLVAQEAQRHMGDGGRIVLSSSVSASVPFRRHAIYSASKGAIEAMARCLALDLNPRGITVNAVAPGGTQSDMASASLVEYQRSGDAVMAPGGRLGTPEEIADVVAFLVSDQARWVTGQTIRVSGGQ